MILAQTEKFIRLYSIAPQDRGGGVGGFERQIDVSVAVEKERHKR